MLLEKKADVNTQGGLFGNALQAALYKGALEIVGMLLEKGADINAQAGADGNALQAAGCRDESHLKRRSAVTRPSRPGHRVSNFVITIVAFVGVFILLRTGGLERVSRVHDTIRNG
jgi:hypothetical protein